MPGGGFGHIQDMINRIRQNESIRKSARTKFKEHQMGKSMSGTGTKMDFSHLSKEQIEEEKERIRIWAKRERLKYISAVIFSVLVCSVFFIWLFGKFL